MAPRKLIWQLFPALMVVFIVAMISLSFMISNRYIGYFLQFTGQSLLDRERLLEPELASLIEQKKWVQLANTAARLGPRGEVRVTLVSTEGTILFDSMGYFRGIEQALKEKEMVSALHGHSVQVQRFDDWVQKEMLYVAKPVRKGAHTLGAVRIGVPLELYIGQFSWTRFQVFGTVISLSIAAVIASLLVVRRLSKPLGEIQKTAESLAKGDLSIRVAGFKSIEFDQIAKSLNLMAGQLSERIETITRQKGEQEAIFEGVTEGLLVLDEQGRVTNLNSAAIKILQIPEVKLKKLVELVRHPVLEEFVQDVLRSGEMVTTQFELFQTEKVIHATGSALLDSQGRQIGVLLSFYDMTHQLKLENVRKEFVANVSHELKTPITSVKGFVETLLDGAQEEPEARDRFLRIVLKQANRLEMIVEDLLSLARIEEVGFEQQLLKEQTNLRELCFSAQQTCLHKGNEKQVAVYVEPGEAIWGNVNAALLEQVVLNLIDNAIKYSPEGATVRLVLHQSEERVFIDVKDDGYGIPQEDQSRIFERFYRVDKARSGKDSSTGLGLAIVKNIIKLHQGTIEVVSKTGEGSTFHVTLPK